MAQIYRTKFFVFLAVLATVVLFQVSPVLASCSYHTYTVNGRMVSCTTCCYGSICNTNCF